MRSLGSDRNLNIVFLGVLGNYNTGFGMANHSFLTINAEFKQTELSRTLNSLYKRWKLSKISLYELYIGSYRVT